MLEVRTGKPFFLITSNSIPSKKRIVNRFLSKKCVELLSFMRYPIYKESDYNGK